VLHPLEAGGNAEILLGDFVYDNNGGRFGSGLIFWIRHTAFEAQPPWDGRLSLAGFGAGVSQTVIGHRILLHEQYSVILLRGMGCWVMVALTVLHGVCPVQNRIAFWLFAAACSTAIGTIAVAQEREAHVPFKPFAIEFLRGMPRSVGGVGIYLGTGFAITAAHVTGQYSGLVRVGGEDVPASLIKFGAPAVDLALFRLPNAKLPSNLQDVSVQLCTEQPPPGTAAVLVTGPDRITDTSLADPAMLYPESRAKLGTMITDVETSGRSGSGVFQADKKCLLGIASALVTNTATQKAVGTFYVPAATIRAFLAGIPAAASLAK
jgi:hypothetical protein